MKLLSVICLIFALLGGSVLARAEGLPMVEFGAWMITLFLSWCGGILWSVEC